MNRVGPAASIALAAVLSVAAAAPASAQVRTESVDTAGRAETVVLPTDAYLDERARETVRRARERRAMYDARIRAYSATAVERMSMGLRAGIAERLMYRRETASRIDWTLDTVRVEVLGAREVAPMFSGTPGVPADLQGYMPSLAFDPVDSEMMLRLDSTSLRHPLATGAEAHYRFESGDSSVISLPDGRTVRLHELRILPRRRDPQLISGSFWVDAATYAVVQVYFRQARGYEASRDSDDCGLSCRIALAVVRPVRMELEYIAIDYGLWDLHWWMPRSIAARGVVQAGRFTVPASFERRYSDYTVEGDTITSAAALDDEPRSRPCRPPTMMSINVGAGAPDSARAARAAEGLEPLPDAAECDRTFIIDTPDDSMLLASELLPASIYSGDAGVLGLAELEAIASGLRRIPDALWQLRSPTVLVPAAVRYNRVEGLFASAGALMDLGVLTLDAAAGMGTGDRRLRGELGITRTGTAALARVAGYSRMAAMDGTTAPFSIGSSLNALMFARDDHQYFRTAGAEAVIQPAAARSAWYHLRMFAERQRAAGKQTDFSLPHVFESDRLFRPNFTADAADQVGATLTLRTSGGLDPNAFRWATALELHGEMGDFGFTRPALRLQASLPFGRFALGTGIAGGSSFGAAPAQREWLLGGASSLRGYSAATLRGEAFWHARVELARGMPYARVAVFGDIGHAGPRSGLRSARPLRSAGLGFSFLDGLFRIDVARPLDHGSWKLHTYFSGIR